MELIEDPCHWPKKISAAQRPPYFSSLPLDCNYFNFYTDQLSKEIVNDQIFNNISTDIATSNNSKLVINCHSNFTPYKIPCNDQTNFTSNQRANLIHDSYKPVIFDNSAHIDNNNDITALTATNNTSVSQDEIFLSNESNLNVESSIKGNDGSTNNSWEPIPVPWQQKGNGQLWSQYMKLTNDNIYNTNEFYDYSKTYQNDWRQSNCENFLPHYDVLSNYNCYGNNINVALPLRSDAIEENYLNMTLNNNKVVNEDNFNATALCSNAKQINPSNLHADTNFSNINRNGPNISDISMPSFNYGQDYFSIDSGEKNEQQNNDRCEKNKSTTYAHPTLAQQWHNYYILPSTSCSLNQGNDAAFYQLGNGCSWVKQGFASNRPTPAMLAGGGIVRSKQFVYSDSCHHPMLDRPMSANQEATDMMENNANVIIPSSQNSDFFYNRQSPNYTDCSMLNGVDLNDSNNDIIKNDFDDTQGSCLKNSIYPLDCNYSIFNTNSDENLYEFKDNKFVINNGYKTAANKRRSKQSVQNDTPTITNTRNNSVKFSNEEKLKSINEECEKTHHRSKPLTTIKLNRPQGYKGLELYCPPQSNWLFNRKDDAADDFENLEEIELPLVYNGNNLLSNNCLVPPNLDNTSENASSGIIGQPVTYFDRNKREIRVVWNESGEVKAQKFSCKKLGKEEAFRRAQLIVTQLTQTGSSEFLPRPKRLRLADIITYTYDGPFRPRLTFRKQKREWIVEWEQDGAIKSTRWSCKKLGKEEAVVRAEYFVNNLSLGIDAATISRTKFLKRGTEEFGYMKKARRRFKKRYDDYEKEKREINKYTAAATPRTKRQIKGIPKRVFNLTSHGQNSARSKLPTIDRLNSIKENIISEAWLPTSTEHPLTDNLHSTIMDNYCTEVKLTTDGEQEFNDSIASMTTTMPSCTVTDSIGSSFVHTTSSDVGCAKTIFDLNASCLLKDNINDYSEKKADSVSELFDSTERSYYVLRNTL